MNELGGAFDLPAGVGSQADVGVVVIGRNEGERLQRCLDSVKGVARLIVYVDSGSTDGSVTMAQHKGIDVVDLDLSTPFTAARARNAGFARLRALAPQVRYVQFVDGDCELFDGWIDAAKRFLDEHPDVACVCGRLRERFPERSVYQRLCDFEWDRPAGETDACGGIAMMRSEVFANAGGFREDLIAGEEPELCLRMRAAGARIWRIPDAMAWHDAAMLRFSQWWWRAVRGGYVYAEGMALHGSHPLAHYRRNLARIIVWSMAIPVMIVSLALIDLRWLALVALYPLQVVRLARRGTASPSMNWLTATFYTLVKIPEGVGACKYWINRARRRRGRLIEYK
jgi:GT2 family glycosyltransferase